MNHERSELQAELETMCEPMLATFDNWGVAPSAEQVEEMAGPFIEEILRLRKRCALIDEQYQATHAELQATSVQAAYWLGRMREVALVAWSQVNDSVDDRSLTILRAAAEFAARCEETAAS